MTRKSTYLIVNGIGDTVVSFRGPLVAALVARGHRVVVSTPRPVEVAPELVERALGELGAECVFSPLDRTGLNPLRERAAARHYRALCERVAPAGVFVSNPKPVFHAIPAARAAGVPRRVAMITGLGYAFIGRGAKAAILRRVAIALYRRALAQATTVLFQNGDDLAYFERAGLLAPGVPVARTGGSGVDLARFPAQPIPGGAPVFLMVARLLGDKCVREFAEAARLVRGARPACRFRLVGWIDSNPAAIARTELDGWIADGRLEWAGRLDDVRGELAAASVFLLPSYREGTPKSTLEALATGRAIVTTDAPGCRETVREIEAPAPAGDGANGVLVPVRDACALANACLALADDPALVAAMGARSRVLAERVFDASLVNATIVEALGA